MMLDPWVTFLKDFGFPVVVAAFVLIRLNGKMDKLVTAMTRLADHLEGYLAGQPKRRKRK